MAKSGIRPDYREIKVIMCNGETFVTRSTHENDDILLEGDIERHPAWLLDNDNRFINEIGSVAKFRNRRGAVNLSGMFAEPSAESNESV